MQFERVFSGSKIDPSFYDLYTVETFLDPNPMPETDEALAALKGVVGTVRRQTGDTTKLYVMKSIMKSNMVKERVQRECEINMKIYHTNVTRVLEIHETADEVILIMDHMAGGDLFDRVAASPNFSLPESEAHHYMRQLMSVVVYLHDMGIAHRDLKPENLMFEKKENDSKLCVLDFGYAKRTEDTLETPIGTLQYLAPEVLESGTYDKSVDIWSVGCILYFMLFGKTPFLAKSDEDIVAKAAVVQFQFPDNVQVSDAAKDLISKLLRKDPTERLTAHQIQTHRWMTNGPSQSPLVTSTELNSSNHDELSELRASINLAIDHAREEAETLAAQAQKSPRAGSSTLAAPHASQSNPSPNPNPTAKKLASPAESPAYKKKTGVGKKKAPTEATSISQPSAQ
jgi:serine/threonine protein kinase